MPRRRVIVLKFGGSVLRSEETLPAAVHEIYRWRRAGWNVVAVVSAFAGETDRALRLCDDADPHVTASLCAASERRAASLLALAADRAGVPARVLTAEALDLIAGGDPLEAEPVTLDDAPFARAFGADEVAIVPGFTAVDDAGRTVVLGRGGSDLATIFIADRLGADRCRLIKDVDGLYERDPALSGPPPRRHVRASWETAITLGGEIIQDRAVRHARDRGVAFELGALGDDRPTCIGPGPSLLEEAVRTEPLRVAMLGCGTVGGGVLARLRAMPDRFDVRVVAVREPAARGGGDVLWTDDAVAAARGDVDVVVETIGGTGAACGAVLAALSRGADVVTANKTLVAEHGRVLGTAAKASGARLAWSAAVGGSVPLLERIAAAGTRRVRSVRAVLNGTTNFVLDRLRAGDSTAEAEQAARERGLAEASSWRDLEGLDAADKLALVALAITGVPLDTRDVARESFADGLARHGGAVVAGRVVRQVAEIEFDGAEVRASVALTSLPDEDPLADVHGARNAAVIEFADGSTDVVRGTGAGRAPTAEAVIADLMDVSRTRTAARRRRALAS